MRRAGSATRRAFSLLEMVLAVALGMVLLLALYLFLNTHLFHAQVGRDALAEGVLARTLLARISSDISGQLGPIDTRVLALPETSSSDSSKTNPPTTSSDPSSSSTTPSSDPPMTNANPMSDTSDLVQFNQGVQGTASTVSLSGYRVRKPGGGAKEGDGEISSDLRRTVYWIVTNGSEPIGLARAEIRQATSRDIDMDPTALPDQARYIIAPEVKSIVFEYYDGTSNSWHPTWDGSVGDGLDGQPLGPPSAIRITITLRRHSTKGMSAEIPEADGPTYQHIVALPTSNSFTPKTGSTPLP